MNELSKKILESYQVRKTKKQKTDFINMMKEELKDKNIQIEEGGFFKCRNIIVGDLEKAKVILAAHYDTAPELPFPNFLTPKNILIYIGYMLLLLVAFEVIMMIGYGITLFITDNHTLAYIVQMLILFFLLGKMLFGKANEHTVNDNTSGVITLIEALQDETIYPHIACVFFDHEETGLFGSSFFAKKHKELMKHKTLINFDCVSDGDAIMIILTKQAREMMEEPVKTSFVSEEKEIIITKSSTTLYPSDQMNFKNAIGVAAFKKNKLFGYYIDRIHTKKDIIFDEKNIEVLIDGLRRLVDRI